MRLDKPTTVYIVYSEVQPEGDNWGYDELPDIAFVSEARANHYADAKGYKVKPITLAWDGV